VVDEPGSISRYTQVYTYDEQFIHRNTMSVFATGFSL
jgi:hypothetical protein